MPDTIAPYRPGLVNWIEVVGLGVIWGAGFLSIRIALEGFAPLWVATGRTTIAALTLALLVAVLRIRLPPLSERQLWAHILGFAVFSNALPFVLIAWAQLHVTSSFVGVTMALVPLFTLVLAHVLLPDEKLTVPRIAGFVLGLVGVVVLIGTEGVSLGSGAVDTAARLACISVTLSYAIGSIIARRSPRVDPVAFTAASVMTSCAAMVPLSLILAGPPGLPALRPVLALTYVGLLPTAVASLLMVHVIRTAGPTFLTQTNYQVPVWSVIFGTLILAEPLPPQFLLALGLILGGLAVSRLSARRRRA
ncbi:MAG: DMT family transporter [Rhodobacteraceae bacterium]|nr:DMT family transporter [Paracoccaceae bacterium]